MKRILGGSAGVLLTQAMLWPHHHVLALVADAISIVALAGANTDRKTSR
jgi:hypothetical protein